MKTLQIKKDTFSDRKKKEFFERYRKAKQVDLPALISERYDIALAPDGKRNWDAEGEGFRLGLKRDQQTGDEVWLATGSITGDAVQTVQQLEVAKMGKELTRTQAVEVIEGFQKGRPQAVRSAEQASAPQPTSIKLPSKADNKSDDLLSYVQSRGISWSTITAAESEGFLQRSEQGLTFIGRDADGKVMQAETRLMQPFNNTDGKQVRFQCAPGSDRSFPPILRGSPDSKEVHIVEGGFDALAVREREARQGNSPTIIMAGGKDSQAWLKHDHIKAILADKEVVVWRDNEKNEEVQAEADEAFKKLYVGMREAGVDEDNIYTSKPTAGIKDVAELNKIEKERERERIAREQQLQQQQSASKSR